MTPSQKTPTVAFGGLVAPLAIAKVLGIAGVIAFFAAHRILAGTLLFLDGLLLIVAITLAYRTMNRLLLIPVGPDEVYNANRTN